MEWLQWIVGYLVVGIAIFTIAWYAFGIKWSHEESDTKTLMVLIVPVWPLVIIFIFVMVLRR